MNFEYVITRLHSYTRLRIMVHVLFWLGCLLLNWYNNSISFNTYDNFANLFMWQLAGVNTINLILVYYPLIYWCVPLLKAKKYGSGIIGIIVLLILYTLGITLSENAMLLNCAACMAELKAHNNGYYHFLQSDLLNRLFAKIASMGVLISLLFSLSVPVAIKIALGAFRQQLAAVQLAKENVELEFNFLKSQVNPHFLFNSLNNIYGLILKNENNKAAGIVARLAEFMRYTLHSPGTDQMPLRKEVDLLRDYIELEKIRLNHTTVTANLDIHEDNHVLPSLLLVPLIENAFKYSADEPGATITIQLYTQAERLTFKVTNALDENRQLNAGGGIGLKNLKKRLDLYYAGKYTYEVKKNAQFYAVNLEISL
ncbi:sensor histidine kinase [Mucilaginibacter sp. HD30]